MKIVNGVTIVTLEVTPDQWNVAQQGLNELPRKISEPLIQVLNAQVQRQVKDFQVEQEAAALAAAAAKQAKLEVPAPPTTPVEQAVKTAIAEAAPAA